MYIDVKGCGIQKWNFLNCSPRGFQKDKKLWDSFQDPPVPQTGGSSLDDKRFDTFKKFFKVFTFVFVFLVTLCAGVVAKTSFLLMTALIKNGTRVQYCDIMCRCSTIINILMYTNVFAFEWKKTYLTAILIDKCPYWIDKIWYK